MDNNSSATGIPEKATTISDKTELDKAVAGLYRLLMKLVKIHRHSDPSAAQLRQNTLQRYTRQIETICNAIKGDPLLGYEEALDSLRRVGQHVPLDQQQKDKFLRKLQQDFAAHLVDDHQFPNLDAGPKGVKKAQMDAYLNKRNSLNIPSSSGNPTHFPHKPIDAAAKTLQEERQKQTYYSKHDLMELFHSNKERRERRQMQHKAEDELRSFIASLRKRDPDQISRTIMSIIKDQH